MVNFGKIKFFFPALVAIFAASVIALSGCTAGAKKYWLEDGKTLHVIDNTLGEGVKYNIKSTRDYTNSSTTEAKSHVYVLPVSETNPSLRYFIAMRQGENSSSTLFAEITNKPTGSKLILDEGFSITALWAAGLTFLDGSCSAHDQNGAPWGSQNIYQSHLPVILQSHYTSVVTTKKYQYASKGSALTVWGYKDLAITVTSTNPTVNGLTFTMENISFLKIPMSLSHTGDMWEIR
jgi:hypothetical protein